jgi:signal transduction histidine kinase
MSDTTLQQAQALLRELIDAAKKGTIIPVRLTGQLEAIEALLEAAATAPQAATAAGSAPDVAELQKAQAYFVSHAVHELRTPMTSIRGYSDMLVSPAMGTLTDMQKQFLDIIRTNSRRMEGLMMDVSDMAKLRGGALRVNQTMELFKNVVGHVEKAMQPVAEQLGRALVFEVPSGLPLLNTDGELLAKAINKLVENGLRYNERADGKVTVRGRADGNTLVIEVEDDGIGIAPEDFARLGEVYFRSDDERVRAHKGSGLGIPIAYGIIALLGGTHTVQTTVGAGTTFTIRLAGMS